jgi:hypothetical protein
VPELLVRLLDRLDLWLHNNLRTFPGVICDVRDRFVPEEERHA